MTSRSNSSGWALRLAALAAFALGVWLRWDYVLRSHHPRHHVYSDAARYVDHAVRLITPGAKEGIFDTIWPPGNAYYLAANLLWDRSPGTAAGVHLLTAVLIPVLVA